MAFRLARMSGRTDVDQMQSEMSTELFDEWIAFYQIDPEPADRIAHYLARITAYLIHWGTQGKEPFDVSKWWINFTDAYGSELDVQSVKSKMMSWKAGVKAAYKAKKKRLAKQMKGKPQAD
jgi:hypothetical protein